MTFLAAQRSMQRLKTMIKEIRKSIGGFFFLAKTRTTVDTDWWILLEIAFKKLDSISG